MSQPKPVAIVRDTVSPENMLIDDTYQGVIAYANGRWRWPNQQVNRFARAGKHIDRIDVNGTMPHGAAILDVERWDATPETAARWVPVRNAWRHDATLYVSLDNTPRLLSVLEPLHQHVWLIIADWTGEPHIPDIALPAWAQLTGTQYASTPAWDLTAIFAPGFLDVPARQRPPRPPKC